jgi:MFS family permease
MTSGDGGDGGLSADAPTVLPPMERGKLLGYSGLLMLLVSFAAPNGGLIAIPVIFFLKNKLHLQAHQMAVFNLWTGLPLYLGFAFGLLRDRWSPFGAGDRGHLVLFGLLTAGAYGIIAFLNPTYALLLVGILLVTAAIQTVLGSATGLLSAVGQEHLMAGQASAVLNVATFIPLLVGNLLGGVLSQALEGRDAVGAARLLFLVGAGLMVTVALLGAFGPRDWLSGHVTTHATNLRGDVARLLKTWSVYPPVILLLLWNFAPALGTALQYHLSNTLHASDVQVGAFYSIFWGLYLPGFMLYSYLCQHVRLSRLLFWGTLAAIPQMLPLLLVHTATGALIAAVPMSLMGGTISAALIDLAIRSCPKGLQATMMMLVTTTAFYLAMRFGDLWGTDLYEHKGGFVTTVIASTVVYALMLPVLLLVPKRLSSTTDGQAQAPA